jgi:hypothetical protein
VLAALRHRSSDHAAPQPIDLALSLERTVAEAWRRPRPAWSAVPVLTDPRTRRSVRAATPELTALAGALRASAGTDAESLRLCLSLIADGFDSPLYGADADALRREAGRLRFRVLAGGLHA